jgi:ubiquinone/menaquinone biosynthesis C-methylase UbiE
MAELLHLFAENGLFAWFLARCGKKTDKYLAGYKSRLFADLAGTVLEIGSGAGANLHHLPSTTITWIGVEPNAFMKPHIVRETQRLGVAIELRPGTAENLPVDDASVDFVISTLVLCSVVDQKRALEEVLRVLKPGGRFLFIEHVAARRGTWLRRIQNLAKPLWRRMGDGCHPDRETRTALERAGFAAIEVVEFAAPLPIVRPHIAGTAVKAGTQSPDDLTE